MDEEGESPYIITKKDVDWAVRQYFSNSIILTGKEAPENKYPHIKTHSQWVKEFGEHKTKAAD